MTSRVFGIVLFTLMTIATASSQVNVYVDPNGNDTNNNCMSSQTPCKTIQHAADVGQNNATIHLTNGTYRLSDPNCTQNCSSSGMISAYDGQTFIGEQQCFPKSAKCGAVVSGGTDITGLVQGPDGQQDWYVTNQYQKGDTTDPCQPPPCDPVGEMAGDGSCALPEDLFIGGQPKTHINSDTRPKLSPGQWWFDYTNHIIYFHDNPQGQTVETSVLQTMFNSRPRNGTQVSNVTIQYLTVEEFASPVVHGAIDPAFGLTPNSTSILNWKVKDSYITLNHADGVRAAFNMLIQGNKIDTNGQFGIGGGLPAGVNITPSGVVVAGNTITKNNFAHVNPGCGAGGIKFGNTAGATVKNNYVQSNLGNGIHFDVNSIGPLVDGNTVTDNADTDSSGNPVENVDGIRFEISNVPGQTSTPRAIFRNNVVQRNGGSNAGPNYQMSSADSSNQEMYCNIVEVPNLPRTHGIGVFASNRTDKVPDPNGNPNGNLILSQNNNVHHNTVFWDTGAQGKMGYFSCADPNQPECQPNFFSDNTPPDNNQYHLSNPTTTTAFIYDGVTSNLDFPQNTAWTFTNYQNVCNDGDESCLPPDPHGTIDASNSSPYPTTLITSPSDGTKFPQPGPITVDATAKEGGGSISHVDLYVDWGQTISMALVNGVYTATWTSTVGDHTLAAMAYDTNGIRACYGITVHVQ